VQLLLQLQATEQPTVGKISVPCDFYLICNYSCVKCASLELYKVLWHNLKVNGMTSSGDQALKPKTILSPFINYVDSPWASGLKTICYIVIMTLPYNTVLFYNWNVLPFLDNIQMVTYVL
jgi:hypothetical protein